MRYRNYHALSGGSAMVYVTSDREEFDKYQDTQARDIMIVAGGLIIVVILVVRFFS